MDCLISNYEAVKATGTGNTTVLTNGVCQMPEPGLPIPAEFVAEVASPQWEYLKLGDTGNSGSINFTASFDCDEL
jgi:hypothetical protein